MIYWLMFWLSLAEPIFLRVDVELSTLWSLTFFSWIVIYPDTIWSLSQNLISANPFHSKEIITEWRINEYRKCRRAFDEVKHFIQNEYSLIHCVSIPFQFGNTINCLQGEEIFNLTQPTIKLNGDIRNSSMNNNLSPCLQLAFELVVVFKCSWKGFSFVMCDSIFLKG